MSEHERDLVGYGANRPATGFPEGKRLAISLVVNYEEGSERSFAMGDPDQETITEWGQYPYPPHIRNLAMETMYEYGSRVGVWRILDIFERHDVKSTFYACAVAFEQTPDVARAVVEQGHEICSHGYRWEEVFRLSEEEEREHIRLAVASFERVCGKRPVGWYCRYGPSTRTRRLLVEEGGFVYDSDSYNDEVPYFTMVGGILHLVVPYTPDANDFGFWLGNGMATAKQFETYLRDSFDVLYAESERYPRMMSIGLHCRVIGRPGRSPSLDRFIAYAKGFDGVWFATREEIARSWLEVHGGNARSAAGDIAAGKL